MLLCVGVCMYMRGCFRVFHIIIIYTVIFVALILFILFLTMSCPLIYKYCKSEAALFGDEVIIARIEW